MIDDMGGRTGLADTLRTSGGVGLSTGRRRVSIPYVRDGTETEGGTCDTVDLLHVEAEQRR
jgi:hypothetical protein